MIDSRFSKFLTSGALVVLGVWLAVFASTPTPPANASRAAHPQVGAAVEWLGQAEERGEILRGYVQTMKDAHVFSELGFERLGTTWENELQRAESRFLSADTSLDVYYALLSLQRTLHDAHSALTVPSALTPRAQALALPFTLSVRGSSLAGGQYVVTQSSTPEIETGLILKQYASRTVPQLESDYAEWLNGSSPELLKMELANALTRTNAKQYPTPDTGLPVALTFHDPASQRDKNVSVRWQPSVPPAPQGQQAFALDYAGINYRVYKDSTTQTLILSYSSFLYNVRDVDVKAALARVSYEVPAFDRGQPLERQGDWRRQFLEANHYPDLKQAESYPFHVMLQKIDTLALGRYLNDQKATNLLVDVRENNGGSVPIDLLALVAKERFRILTLEQVFVPLFKRDPAFLQESLTFADNWMRRIIADQLAREPGASRSRRLPFSCKSANCSLDQAIYDPAAGIKKYNLAVLSGPGCVSACDQFVAIVADNHLAPVVGLPSRGAHSPMRAKKEFDLKNGDTFSMVFTTGVGYRPNGEPLEGNPARVEYYLFPEDDYVSKVIGYLKTKGTFK